MNALRLSLTGTKRPDVKIHLCLPVTPENKLDVGRLPGWGSTQVEWPRAYGYWEGSVFGHVEWDEENRILTIQWSDEDLSLVDLTPEIELKPGRLFDFHSNTWKTDTAMIVTSASPLRE